MDKREKLLRAYEYLVEKLIVRNKRDLANRIKIHEGNLSKQFANPSDKFLMRFNKSFDYIFNEQWLLRDAVGPMLASDDVEYSFTKPRLTFNANAGSLTTEAPAEYLSRGEQIPIIPTLPKYDFTIIISGDSMCPNFMSGDELACRFVNTSDAVLWGRPHVLTTRDGVVVKRIYDAGKYFRCVSYNSEEYPEYKIEKDNVFQLAIVVGVLRSLG